MKKLISWVKGKIKQREIRKREPNKDFQFEENYYGNTDIIDGFKFIYCNNYTKDLFDSKQYKFNHLEYISCVVSINNSEKSLKDLFEFHNIYIENILEPYMINLTYRKIYFEYGLNSCKIFLRGDLLFYMNLCDKIHNNIITRYIRNNIFPNEIPIETPNEFLQNKYNSINCPSKEIDILFIEDEFFNKFNPVVGLSISKNYKDISKYFNINSLYSINDRYIIYTEINKLDNDFLNHVILNVNHGEKLFNISHQSIKNNTEDSDVDEIIEEFSV